MATVADSSETQRAKIAVAEKVDHRTGAARLLERKQRMLELQELLDTEKQVYASKEVAFQEREQALKARDAKLADSFVCFSKYLQENDSKRARALKKAADERKLCEEKAAEARKLAQTADEVAAEVAESRDVVARNSRHQRYLEAVIERREAFQEIGDLIARHSTLAATNDDLRRQQFHAAHETERMRLEMHAYAKAKAAEILAANAQLPRLQKEIEAAKQEAAALDAQREAAAARVAQQRLSREQVTLAARNLHRACLEHSKVVHSSETDLAAQLKVIGNFVSDYQTITRMRQ